MKLLQSISLILMLSVFSVASAQQDPPPTDAEQPSGVDKPAEVDADKKTDSKKAEPVEKSNNKPPKKVFKPSEEISEDSPVPFPIDI